MYSVVAGYGHVSGCRGIVVIFGVAFIPLKSSGFVAFEVIGDLLNKFRSKARLRKITEMYNEALSSILANFYVAVLSRYNLAIPRSLSYFTTIPLRMGVSS